MVAVVFVALWLPLVGWLLAIEAMDHPGRPQTIMDYIGFYLGSTVFVAIPSAVAILILKNRT